MQAGCPVDGTDNSYHSTVLLATLRGDLKNLECLLQAGADPTPAHATSWENIPLYDAGRRHCAEIVKRLLAHPLLELPQKNQIYEMERH